MGLSSRRTVLTGLAALAAASPARAEPAEAWLAYERRLQARSDDAAGGRFDGTFEHDLLALTVSFRAEQGLEALAEDAELTKAARAHAADMAARKFFAHDTEEGFSSIDRAGLLVRRMVGLFGENLAARVSPASVITPRSTIEGWRSSPGHRANLISRDFTHVGHGVVRIGQSLTIVSVFGGRAASLAQPLPLRVEGPAINQAFLAAGLAAYYVSEPRQEPRGDPYPTPGIGPKLAPGAWRLRPLKSRGGRAFNVLWGPIVVV